MEVSKKDQRLESSFSLVVGGHCAEVIHDKLVAVHRHQAVSRSRVQRWTLKFVTDPMNVKDTKRSRRPWVRASENIEKVRRVLEADKWNSVKQIAHSTGLSIGHHPPDPVT